MLSIVEHRCFTLSMHFNHFLVGGLFGRNFLDELCLKSTVKCSFVGALAHARGVGAVDVGNELG